VANQVARTVAAVDLTAFAVARQVQLFASPTQVIADPVRPSVYVLTPETGTIHEITVDKLAVGRRAAAGRGAVSMRLSAQGDALWVLCRQPQQVVRVPLETLRPEGAIPLPDEPVDLDIDQRNGLLAVSFGPAGSVGVIEPATRTCHLFRAGKKLSLVRFRSDGKQLLVGNTEDRSILVLSAPGGRTVVNLPLAVRPDHFCFNADQGQLFVTGEGMDAVVVVYPYQTQVAETVLAGRAPGAMGQCTTPEVSFLFVANPTSREVTIMDIDTRKAIASATVGAGPAFITTTPDFQYALVLNRDSGDMAVIRIAAIASTRAKSAPLFTMIPVGSGPVSAAVRAV
jgi:hypothetical protein